MSRTKMFSQPLTRELPRVRVSEPAYQVVRLTAQEYNVTVSDVVRACIADRLGFHYENSDFIIRILKKVAQEFSSEDLVEATAQDTGGSSE
jgi:hypothetical protein